MFKLMIKRILLPMIAGMFLIGGCTEPVIPDDPDDGGTPKIVGTLEVEFRVPSTYLPANRVVRADLSIAKTAEDLYKGHFYQVANVYNSKLVYTFDIPPGNYYYQAGIVCLAGGDSCSAAGFPGGHYGMKWAIGTATVVADETVHVTPQFTR
ncbi:MAG: hypothetical protein V2A67_00620 [Bacteroidota bacterium]